MPRCRATQTKKEPISPLWPTFNCFEYKAYIYILVYLYSSVVINRYTMDKSQQQYCVCFVFVFFYTNNMHYTIYSQDEGTEKTSVAELVGGNLLRVRRSECRK